MKSIDRIEDELIDLGLLKEIPLSFAKGNLLVPLRKEDGCLVAACADDRGILALVELARRYGLKPLPLRADSGVVLEAVNR
ncbi:MAG: type II secretion system protein GspE, partial [Nitrospirales bacterium]|nr:type II secretion system protein GspE [Nitrospirales bacterium]